METKKCSRFKKILSINYFYIKYKNPTRYYPECKSCRYEITKNYAKRNESHCKERASRYYKENKDTIKTKRSSYRKNNYMHVLEINQVWVMENKQKVLETKRIHNKKLRETFLDMYGRSCACCGETAVEFLTIEHKLGQKGIVRHKKETGKFAYSKATKEYRPDLYEVLCMNCNFSKGRYGYCPHQK